MKKKSIKKEVTNDELARMIAKGFAEVGKNFEKNTKEHKDIKDDLQLLRIDVKATKENHELRIKRLENLIGINGK